MGDETIYKVEGAVIVVMETACLQWCRKHEWLLAETHHRFVSDAFADEQDDRRGPMEYESPYLPYRFQEMTSDENSSWRHFAIWQLLRKRYGCNALLYIIIAERQIVYLVS